LSAVGEPVTKRDLEDEFVINQARVALGELHSKGVAHRDLHEGNILIDRTSGKVTLIDLEQAIDLDQEEAKEDRAELLEREWSDLERLIRRRAED
jgi:serine/threonine protein kinase